MAHIQVTDEWLYKYMPVVDEALVRELEGRVDYEYGFSDRFEKRMRRLIRRKRRMGGVGREIRRFGSRAAVFVVAAAALFMAVAMGVEAYRIKFFQTLKTFLGNHYEYRYSVEGEEDPAFTATGPEVLLGEYRLVSEDVDTFCNSFVYKNSDGVELFLEQHVIRDGTKIYFDSEYDRKTTIQVRGLSVDIFRYDEGDLYTYLEYENCIYRVDAVNITDEQVAEIYDAWLWQK